MADDDFFLIICPNPLYLHLLSLEPACENAIEAIEKGLRLQPHPESKILVLLTSRNWRSHLVGAAASLLLEAKPEIAQGLWNAFDASSWVSPQLAVSAFLLDSRFSEEARTRIERAFATLSHTPPPSQHLGEADWRQTEACSLGIQRGCERHLGALLSLWFQGRV
jgi:hypothetical protein